MRGGEECVQYNTMMREEKGEAKVLMEVMEIMEGGEGD